MMWCSEILNDKAYNEQTWRGVSKKTWSGYLSHANHRGSKTVQDCSHRRGSATETKMSAFHGFEDTPRRVCCGFRLFCLLSLVFGLLSLVFGLSSSPCFLPLDKGPRVS